MAEKKFPWENYTGETLAKKIGEAFDQTYKTKKAQQKATKEGVALSFGVKYQTLDNMNKDPASATVKTMKEVISALKMTEPNILENFQQDEAFSMIPQNVQNQQREELTGEIEQLNRAKLELRDEIEALSRRLEKLKPVVETLDRLKPIVETLDKSIAETVGQLKPLLEKLSIA